MIMSRAFHFIPLIIGILAVIAMLGSSLVAASADTLSSSSLVIATDGSSDAGKDRGNPVLLDDECHTCAHVVIPVPATHATRIAAILRWQVPDEEWAPTAPQAEIPPPRSIGREVFESTSIPIIEVNHVSLCTDRFHCAPRHVERTS